MNPRDKNRTLQQLRHSNSLAVFNEVLFNAPVPRADIAKRTLLTPTSVSRITRQLIDAGLVEEFEARKTGLPGRQSINLRLKQDGGYVVGVAINAFEHRIALSNLQRDVIAEVPLPRDVLDPKQAAKIIAAEISKLLDKQRINRHRLFGIGIANAGVVDSEKGLVVRAPTLNWQNVPLGLELQERLHVPVCINSSAGAIAAAEHRFGIAQQFRNFIVVHTTLGLGMCIFSDGRALHGHLNQAGLIGETPVQSQIPNSAKQIRQLDEVAGGTAMVRKWLSEGTPSLLGEPVRRAHFDELAKAVQQGDPKALEACDEGSSQLASVTVTLASALSSEAVLFVGPLMKIHRYRSRIESILSDRLGSQRSLKVIVSEKRSIKAASMLAINELATTGTHLARIEHLVSG